MSHVMPKIIDAPDCEYGEGKDLSIDHGMHFKDGAHVCFSLSGAHEYVHINDVKKIISHLQSVVDASAIKGE